MSELIYPPVIRTCLVAFRALGMRIRVHGAEHVPTRGGAVLASNHVSYLDFVFAGLAARPSRRLVRFMAKEAVFRHRISGPLMRGMRHIAVDRAAGAGSFATALTALRAGEVVGVFPEATISRSFTVKEIKSGAGRMSFDTGVPLVPMAVWGSQRFWTKGRPKALTRRGVAVDIVVGEALRPADFAGPQQLTAGLRERMASMLDRAQREYPDQPAGDDDRWWLPAHLGGTAPTPAEAARLDAVRPG